MVEDLGGAGALKRDGLRGKRSPLLVQRQVQIIPIWIGRLDQFDLPSAAPGFDLLRPRLCRLPRLLRFAPYEARELVFARERAATTGAVLVSAPCEIVCVTAIKCPVLAIGHQIDPEDLVHAVEGVG